MEASQDFPARGGLTAVACEVIEPGTVVRPELCVLESGQAHRRGIHQDDGLEGPPCLCLSICEGNFTVTTSDAFDHSLSLSL